MKKYFKENDYFNKLNYVLCFIVIISIIFTVLQIICMKITNPFDVSSYRITSNIMADLGLAVMYISLIPLLLATIIISIISIIKSIKNKMFKRIIVPILSIIIVIVVHIIFRIIQYNYRFRYVTVDKPVMYIYPIKEMDLNIKLGNSNLLSTTYPEYNSGWNVHVDENGNIYDYNTKRNYYSLFWDAKDDTKINTKEGFVISKEETVNFLEEKLEYLGLNEREIEEFIIYWLPQLNKNNYNYIRFRTIDEINNYMPLYFDKKPDTLIRVIMDFKGLDKKINVKEQKLKKVTRSGYTIVEWGGRNLSK